MMTSRPQVKHNGGGRRSLDITGSNCRNSVAKFAKKYVLLYLRKIVEVQNVGKVHWFFRLTSLSISMMIGDTHNRLPRFKIYIIVLILRLAFNYNHWYLDFPTE